MDDSAIDRLFETAQAATRLYKNTIDRAHLDCAREEYESLIDLLSPQHSKLVVCKTALAEVHILLGQHTGEIEHFNRAVSLARDAAQATDEGSLDVDQQACLATAYWRRAQETNEAEDFDSAVRHFDTAIVAAGNHHPRLGRLVSDRGAILLQRVEHGPKGERIPIHRQALGYQEAALKHPFEDDVDRATVLEQYAETAVSLSTLAPEFSNFYEIALSAAQESIQLTPKNHYLYWSRWNNIGVIYWIRWRLSGTTQNEDFHLMLQSLLESLRSLPEDHRRRNVVILNLSELLLNRYTELGTLDDLDEAIANMKNVLGRLPDTHPHQPYRVRDLGIALVQSFRNRGIPSILDEAMELHERRRWHAAPGNRWLYDLGIGDLLMERYAHQHNDHDLDTAIGAFEVVLDEVPLHRRSMGMQHLSKALAIRYITRDTEDDLRRAIRYFDMILEEPTQGISVQLSEAHDNYGLVLLTKYHRESQLGDLHDALRHFDAAVSSVRAVHLSLGMHHCHSGITQRLLFQHTTLALHLDRSIMALRDSVRCTSARHPLLSKHRYELAISLVTRFDLDGSQKDLIEASALLRQASQDEHCFLVDRWMAARERASLMHDDHRDASSALDSYELAISLLPTLAWLGLEERVRYETAQQWLSLGNDAAACALQAGKPETAVECLENSRSVLWNQLFQLGHSHEAIRRIEPALADEMQAISNALEATMNTTFTATDGDDKDDGRKKTEQVGRARRHLAERWDDLLREVHQRFPEVEEFFGWSTFDHLRGAASGGPVVLINMSRHRCDGIILTESDSPLVFELPDARLDHITLWALHYNTILTQTKDRAGLLFAEQQVSLLLDMLWRDIGAPMCEALKPFRQGGRLPRIWLIPTGPLAALPLHAAMSNGSIVAGLQDMMIPSYTPTLSALIRGRRASEVRPFKLLTVGGAISSKHPPLPAWNHEKASIQRLFSQQQITVLEDEKATRDEVSEALSSHNFVHLSCHGEHDWVNPYRSHLSLSDGDLTLRSIAYLKLEHAAFAFLSACHTARVDPRAPDEVVHLASGMNLAGFRSIIATMWGIADIDAPVAAEAVYAHMTRDGRTPDPSEAAEALHKAVLELRTREVPVIRWAPFIHIGI